MKKQLFLLSATLFFCTCIYAQKVNNWTASELMQTSELAGTLNKNDSIIIISVGPFTTIPGTISTGPVNEKEGLDKFTAELKLLTKDQKIVIYCGCCPSEHCPNIRPAIDVLKEMKFTNFYLLNIPDNLKIDWIDKGYPVSK